LKKFAPLVDVSSNAFPKRGSPGGSVVFVLLQNLFVHLKQRNKERITQTERMIIKHMFSTKKELKEVAVYSNTMYQL
jgi:hypothetical protein